MIDTILGLLIGPLGAALGAILAIGLAYLRGRSAGQDKAKRTAMEKEIKGHERITEADIGIGASDAERRKRLHDMGNDWR